MNALTHQFKLDIKTIKWNYIRWDNYIKAINNIISPVNFKIETLIFTDIIETINKYPDRIKQSIWEYII
jgi:hypothetical protein